MDIGKIFGDAIRFPSSDWMKVLILGAFPTGATIITLILIYALGYSGGLTGLATGGIIGLVLSLIAGIIVMGYVFKSLQASIAGLDLLPEFDNWGEIIVDGLKVLIVQIIYLIIPIIVILIGAGASILAASNNPMAALGAVGLTAIIGIIVALIFELIAAIGIANMALYDGEFGAAFRFSEIMERISIIGWGNYIVWYVVVIIIYLVAGFIARILGYIPIVGLLIASLVVYPYMYLVIARALALLFGETIEQATEQPVEEAPAE